MVTRLRAVALGLALDRALGEPPRVVHPVARFGQMMTGLEARWWRDDRGRGAVHAATGVAVALALAEAANATLGSEAALVAATALCSAGRALSAEARAIGDRLVAGEVEEARAMLPALVGRDTEALDDKEMARAVVESVAENLSDAVVGTALWGTLCGAPGAVVHRALNTLDAMVGHRTERYLAFGWASARLDDLLGWPAARLTAALVALTRPAHARAVLSTVRSEAHRHPSPNAGVAEAAFAAALGLQLGGTNRYGGREEIRPLLGAGRPAEAHDVARAVALADDVVRLLMVLGAASGLLACRHRRASTRRGAP